ncbi:breast cancer type 2 susceptibility protein isoform X2 [Rana temporaria]|uniref:breast cancer type 2 susceptibility protein isoform X2 n=1 Tax=Rana temporaria TaxID=8407 RepID=UPI001AAC67F2|nr:breast cancer type 2 susceptibility protein isoform X2 [Rana temporaria]
MAAVQLGGSVFLHLLRAHCPASDLGPISVNWFEELTAEAVQRQSRLCVDEEKGVEGLDDSLFKTPKRKRPIDSQLDSTPIIFKEQSLCSPLFLSPTRDFPKNQPSAKNVSKTEKSPGDATQCLRDEVFGTSKQCHNSPSVMGEMFKTPLWDKKYTYRTPQRDWKNDVFDSLCCTPKFIGNTTSRCISESLGAEADPEMSWSSSLATPPSPTVIIAQANDETSKIRPFDNKDAVIVQSLFSKLCNDAETSFMAGPTDPKVDKDFQMKADDHLADSAYAVPNEAARGAFESSESGEVQKNVLKNKDACQKTENVLEGMEDILSIFFTREKPPGLRKVKVDNRAKRRKKNDSNGVQESAVGQSIFSLEAFLNMESQNKCNKPELENTHVANFHPSSMPSSYEWSPIALPDLNTTQGDVHLPVQTDVIYGGGKELGPSITNYSPTRNSGKSSSYHTPAGSCKVANGLEMAIPITVQQTLPDTKPDVDTTCSAQNTRPTEGTTSADLELSAQQVLVEINEKRPQIGSTNIKATLSILKRQPKFLYCLNDGKNGQDGRTRDIGKVSHNEPIRIPEKHAGFGEVQKELDSVNAACTHIQQDAQLEPKEDSEYLKEDALDVQEIEENLLNLKHVDKPISKQAPRLDTATDISTTINIQADVKGTEHRNTGDASKKSLLESVSISKKNSIDKNVGHSDVTLAKKQVMENDHSSDVTKDHKEQLDSHEECAFSTTEHHNASTDSLPLDVSLCIRKVENFGGFKTGSNKLISISEENLRKGELLFKDDDPIHHISHPLPPAVDINNTLDIADSASVFNGFRTASRKEIKVDECKIAKGMLLFKDLEDGMCDNIITNKDLRTPAANLVPENEKAREPDNNFEPLNKLSTEETKDSRTSNLLRLNNHSSKEVQIKGMRSQNVLLLQHSKSSTSDGKSQKETSLSSEIQSRFCEILTESQKAEVSELSSILENADSQFDFTQFRKTGTVTSNNNQNLRSAEDGIGESENLNNSDVWNDVDFNDSFATGAEHVENKDSSVKLSLEKKDNSVGATAYDSGVASVSEKLVSKDKKKKFGGFSLASGKCINITDDDMVKAFELFCDLDDTTLSVKHPSTDVNKGNFPTTSAVPSTPNVQQVSKDSITVPRNVKESSIVYSKTESSTKCEKRSSTFNEYMFNREKHNSKMKLMNEFVDSGNEVSGSEEAFCVQNINTASCGSLASASCVSTMPVGFSTGKGKVISVDKAALAKAKSIFNDLLHPDDIDRNQGSTSGVVVKENINTISHGEPGKRTHELTVEQSAVGFITSGTGAPIPHDSVQKEKTIFDKVSGSELAHCISLPKEDTLNTKRVEFSTAHGKSVHLSEESLRRAQEIFADIDDHHLVTVGENSKFSLCDVEKISSRSPNTNNVQDVLSKTLQEKEPVLPLLGFSTASGKSVVVSCDSLQKAKMMFAETDLAVHNGLEGIEYQQMHDRPRSNPAEIKLSKPNIRGCNVATKNTTQVIVNVPPPLGFSTASGKTVAVSNESLQKARRMLSDTDNSGLENGFQSSQTGLEIGNQEKCRDLVLCSSENTKLSKVRLAEGNPMKPFLRDGTTDSCLEKTDLPPIVKTSRVAQPRDMHLPQETAPNIVKPSFITAGGKPLQMSENALKKACEMFAEIDGQLENSCSLKQSVERNTKWNTPESSNVQDPASPTVSKETILALPAPGFSTASGKNVAVSADALLKARILLADGEDGITDESIAQGKSKAISVKNREENEKASKMLVNNSFMPGMPCFSTASGKTVTLSEEALKKAQQIFSEMENCPSQQDKLEDVLGDNPLRVSKVQTSLHQKPKEQTTLETSETSNLPKTTTNRFGFSTASGKQVSVSETAIQTVKDLFQEFTESENLQEHCPNGKGDSNSSKTANTLTPLVNKADVIANFNDELVELQNHRARTRENINIGRPSIASSCDSQRPMLRHSTPFHNTRVPSKRNTVSSMTSRTPENYFEIEAAESAKAFMDDEDLTDGIMKADATNKLLILRNGKRLRSDDRTSHGEPPIKRQLLPEFDRSLMQESKLALKPLTSSPHSDFKDRRKFVYNVSLKASFCDPMSFSAGNKEAQKSQLITRSAAFRHSSSDISADASDDGRQLKDIPSYKPATGTSEEWTSDQDDLEPHNSADVSQLLASLHCARDLQEMRVRKKQRQNIKPYSGSLYGLKATSTDRITLISAVQGKLPTMYPKEQLYRFGVLKNHIGIDSETAKIFDFHCLDYFTKSCLSGGGVQIADGGWLIPSDKLTAGREEFYRALCDTTGVDPKLISSEWVYNHYRWIVWKLAAMEVMFPEQFAGRCLTPERVLLQLKYRYEVEIDKSRRSALKRIMERDDTAAKTLVLCVSKVISWGGNDKSESKDTKQGPAVIEVTDGWYGIKALLDTSLTALLHRRRLFVGQKIIIHGAELVGSEEACTPLEAPESLMLKLAANSTRPARWYTKLGYFCDPRPFCVPLSSLLAEGGIVGCVDIVIQRIYPIQWMEKMANGTYVFRNDRAEKREAERHSLKQQKNLEVLFLKIQQEFEQQEACESKAKGTKRNSLSVTQIAALQDGAEIYEALQNEPDPGYLESCMSSEQLRVLNHYRQVINDKKQALIQTEFRKAIESTEQGSEGCTRREVTPVWKVRIVDYKEQDPTSAYILNIWRPLPDLVSLLKEGCHFKIYQLATSHPKCKADTAAVQLTATKKTQFQQLQSSQDILEQIYTERQVTDFSQLMEPNFKTEYGEVDIVGLVISIHQKIGAAPIVYLSDEAHDIVAVKFWIDLSQLSLEELAKPGTLIAASNLRWRSESTAGIPIVSFGDLSYITANPKETHLQKAIHKLRQSVQATQKFHHEAEIQLFNILRVPHPEEKPPPAQHSSDSYAATTKFSTPAGKLGSAQMNPLNTPSRSNTVIISGSDMDPKTCKKIKGLDLLSRIPSPPPITPVRPSVTPSLQRAFRPPRSMQKDVQTSEQPILSKGEFVDDEELAMINTQALVSGLEKRKIQQKIEMSAEKTEKISPDQSDGKPDPSGNDTKKEDTGHGKLHKRRRHKL